MIGNPGWLHPVSQSQDFRIKRTRSRNTASSRQLIFPNIIYFASQIENEKMFFIGALFAFLSLVAIANPVQSASGYTQCQGNLVSNAQDSLFDIESVVLKSVLNLARLTSWKKCLMTNFSIPYRETISTKRVKATQMASPCRCSIAS